MPGIQRNNRQQKETDRFFPAHNRKPGVSKFWKQQKNRKGRRSGNRWTKEIVESRDIKRFVDRAGSDSEQVDRPIQSETTTTRELRPPPIVHKITNQFEALRGLLDQPERIRPRRDDRDSEIAS